MSPTRCWFRSLSCLQRISVLDLPKPGSYFPSCCMHTLSVSPTFHSNARRTEFSHLKSRSMSKKNETSKDRTGRLSSLEQTAMWKQEDLTEEKPSRLAIPELPKRSKGQMAWSLVNTISGLSNAKDEVYGAMDTWCAWELEFPMVAVKQALRILKEKQEWLRIIQVTKWMLSKGHGHTMGSYQLLIQALDQTGRLEEAEDIWNMFVMKKAESVPRMMFGHIIKIYDQHEMFQKAILVFKSMEEMAIYPDDGTVVKMGEIYEKIGFPERKDELLEKYGKTWKYVYSKRTRAMVPVKRRNIDKETMVKVVAPQYMPKLGKAGSLHSRQAILHSLVHTESWAVDLAWDIIARFGRKEAMPRAFFDDFVRVAEDEGRHFKLLEARLKQLGSFYGAFPVHDGLWDSAATTSNELDARLAVEHCVHEARGLDVIPTTISRFRKGGDEESANLLELVIYPEEITHCAAGVRWFSYLFFRSHPLAMYIPITKEQQHESGDGVIAKLGLEGSKSLQKNEDDGFESLIAYFHVLVKKCFRGPLKPPFNEWARLKAGFGPEWYVPLSQKECKCKLVCDVCGHLR